MPVCLLQTYDKKTSQVNFMDSLLYPQKLKKIFNFIVIYFVESLPGRVHYNQGRKQFKVQISKVTIIELNRIKSLFDVTILDTRQLHRPLPFIKYL